MPSPTAEGARGTFRSTARWADRWQRGMPGRAGPREAARRGPGPAASVRTRTRARLGTARPVPHRDRPCGHASRASSEPDAGRGNRTPVGLGGRRARTAIRMSVTGRTRQQASAEPDGGHGLFAAAYPSDSRTSVRRKWKIPTIRGCVSLPAGSGSGRLRPVRATRRVRRGVLPGHGILFGRLCPLPRPDSVVHGGRIRTNPIVFLQGRHMICVIVRCWALTGPLDRRCLAIRRIPPSQRDRKTVRGRSRGPRTPPVVTEGVCLGSSCHSKWPLAWSGYWSLW